MKFGCSTGIFLNTANLICRSTDISNCFRGSLRLRNNESRLYVKTYQQHYLWSYNTPSSCPKCTATKTYIPANKRKSNLDSVQVCEGFISLTIRAVDRANHLPYTCTCVHEWLSTETIGNRVSSAISNNYVYRF